MDNSIICYDEYFQIQQNLSANNIDFSVNMEINNDNPYRINNVDNMDNINIFNSPKKCGRNSMDLEISYVDEQYFENSNMFEPADQEREEPCIILNLYHFNSAYFRKQSRSTNPKY